MQTADEGLVALASIAGGATAPVVTPARGWPVIIELAIRHGIAPLVLYRIREAAIELPEADLAPLKRASSQSAARYALQEAAHVRLENALRDGGVDAVWLKGIALAQTVYPQPTLRPMNDLDALIPSAQHETALKIAQAEGYAPPQSSRFLISPQDPMMRGISHHDYLVGGPSKAVTLELHWRLISTDDATLAGDETRWFLENSQIIETRDVRFKALSPTACLLYLCAHAEIQHLDFYLLRYLDLHLLMAKSVIDWKIVIDRAVVLRWTFPVEQALRACVKLFGSAVPVDALEQLTARRLESEDMLRAQMAKGQGSRWVRVRQLLRRLPPSDRWRLITSALFPPPAYMRERYSLPAGQAVWPSYLYRWFDQGRETWRAIIRERQLRQQDRSQKRSE